MITLKNAFYTFLCFLPINNRAKKERFSFNLYVPLSHMVKSVITFLNAFNTFLCFHSSKFEQWMLVVERLLTMKSNVTMSFHWRNLGTPLWGLTKSGRRHIFLRLSICVLWPYLSYVSFFFNNGYLAKSWHHPCRIEEIYATVSDERQNLLPPQRLHPWNCFEPSLTITFLYYHQVAPLMLITFSSLYTYHHVILISC